jgi:surfeit locus 1 family protein
MRLRGRDWLLAVLAIVAAGVCTRLGVWQLDRLTERRARNAAIRALAALPAVEIRAGMPSDSIVGRRVFAVGVYDYDQERLWRGRPHRGVPGLRLITPLRLVDGWAVLVDRGWVSSPDAARIDRAAYRGPDSGAATGVGVLMPRGRGDVDPRMLADSLAYPLLPYGVQLQRPPAGSEPARPPIPLPSAALGDGPHLYYAIQWFSFAAVVLVGTFALLRQPRATARRGMGKE